MSPLRTPVPATGSAADPVFPTGGSGQLGAPVRAGPHLSARDTHLDTGSFSLVSLRRHGSGCLVLQRSRPGPVRPRRRRVPVPVRCRCAPGSRALPAACSSRTETFA